MATRYQRLCEMESFTTSFSRDSHGYPLPHGLPLWPQGISDFVRWRASQHLSHGTHTATHYRTGCRGRLRQRLGPEIWVIFQGTTVLRLFATPSSLDSIVASFNSRFVQRKYTLPA